VFCIAFAWRIVGGTGDLGVGIGKGPVYKNMHASWRSFSGQFG
jgi:hypothetical protein